MPVCRLPVRPNLKQLHRQAKEFLRATTPAMRMRSPDEARFTRLLLDRGADPNIRASLRARLEEGHGGGPLREYRDVTPLGWGEQYHARIFVSRESLRVIEVRGGGR